MSLHPEANPCSDFGLVLVLNDPAAWVPEAIGDSDKLADQLKKGKYAKKEVGMDQNKWVDDLSTELTQFGRQCWVVFATSSDVIRLQK
jgi:major membrane immunogen (membrane-anchored lipoprotein)